MVRAKEVGTDGGVADDADVLEVEARAGEVFDGASEEDAIVAGLERVDVVVFGVGVDFRVHCFPFHVGPAERDPAVGPCKPVSRGEGEAFAFAEVEIADEEGGVRPCSLWGEEFEGCRQLLCPDLFGSRAGLEVGGRDSDSGDPLGVGL